MGKFKTHIVLGGLGFTLLIGFINCGQMKSAVDQASLASSTCTQKIKSVFARMTALSINCLDYQNYSCDQKSFHPGLQTDNENSEGCIETDAGVRVCVPVQVFHFDTSQSAARLASDAPELQPGGSYNRDDFYCYNKAVVDGSVAVHQGEGSDLKTALQASVTSCQKYQSQK